jgi:hypothetical protein
MIEEVPAAGKEGDALDSGLDLDLDSYCGRMRSETAQGDELTVRAAAWALQINIRVLKLNSTTATIMTLTYPGTPPTSRRAWGPRTRLNRIKIQPLPTLGGEDLRERKKLKNCK